MVQSRWQAGMVRLIRGGLAAYPAVVIGAWIATQYWHDRYFSLIVPGLVGLAVTAAASTASGERMGVALGVPAAVVAVALSDSLVPGGAGLVSPPGQALPPYAAAVVGAVAWPLLFGAWPARSRTGRGQRSGNER